MSQTTFDYNAYTQHAEKVAARFEERRAVFLTRFRLRMIISLLIIVSLPFWFSLLSSWNAREASVISGFGQAVVNVLAGLVIILGAVVYAILPLFRYRNYTMQYGTKVPGMDGFAQQHVSLKSEIFSQLLGFFGTFTLHNERKLSLKRFRDAPNMPDFDEFVSEDYIEGRMDGVKVEMTEARFITRLHKSYVNIFSGLIMIIDVDDPKSLRGRFAGKTVIISDRPQAMDYVASKYESFKRVPIADSAFESRFEAFTTNNVEAEKLTRPELLRAILKLSDTVRHTKQQYLSLDDRVGQRIGQLANAMSDILVYLATRVTLWLQTGSFTVLSTRHALIMPDAIRDDAKALNQCVHAVFYEDKLIVTVPYSRHFNLFEPDSLLRSPLNPADIEMVYQLMSSISTIIQNTLPALKAD